MRYLHELQVASCDLDAFFSIKPFGFEFVSPGHSDLVLQAGEGEPRRKKRTAGCGQSRHESFASAEQATRNLWEHPPALPIIRRDIRRNHEQQEHRDNQGGDSQALFFAAGHWQRMSERATVCRARKCRASSRVNKFKARRALGHHGGDRQSEKPKNKSDNIHVQLRETACRIGRPANETVTADFLGIAYRMLPVIGGSKRALC
jgi:hypothetical protein